MPTEEPANKPKPKPKPKQVLIELPKGTKGVYANLAFISHTPAEIVLDFAQVLPRMPKGSVVSRVIMSPMHAKLLQNALAQNIANFERQFGEIKIPRHPNLADQFFKFKSSEAPDDEPDKEE